jgi:hypothetical protein
LRLLFDSSGLGRYLLTIRSRTTRINAQGYENAEESRQTVGLTNLRQVSDVRQRAGILCIFASATPSFELEFPGESHLNTEGVEMNKFRSALAGVAATLLLTAGLAFADSAAIQTMARITMSLNHFPSDDDKVALKAIIDSDDSSEEEAAIAMALSNMQHKVTAADAERLADIVDDPESDGSARQLSGILLHVNHAPSDEDKVALAALAGM